MGAKVPSPKSMEATNFDAMDQPAENQLCPACLDLRHIGFRAPHVEPLLYRGQDLRYHITSFWNIAQEADRGCCYCSVIREGIHWFWGEMAGTFDKAPSELALDGPQCKEPNRAFGMTSGNENGDENRFYWACIEIRPTRSLLVSCVAPSRLRVTAKSLEIVPGSDELQHFLQRAPLEFSIQEGTVGPSTAFGISRPMPLYLGPQGSTYCKKLLLKWLNECITDHVDCQRESGNGRPPKRLLDLSCDTLKLVETTSEFQEQYTTLSHCWGSTDDFLVPKTLRSNLTQRLQHVDLQELPRAFQDAVQITKMVGRRFLWIDSLCIIQDDEDDWKEQSYLMVQIYSQSYLNIAATASPNSSKSIFFKRYHPCEPDYHPRSMEAHALSNGVSVRLLPQITHGNFVLRRPEDSNAPLLKRGWVFQERLLSRRTIHFASSELVWECREHTHCECGELDDADLGRQIRTAKSQFESCFRSETTRRSVLDTWLSLVTRYNNLRFTNNRDWSFAFAGIAERIQTRVDSTYLAGLWATDLARGLLWIGLKEEQSRSNTREDGHRTWDGASKGYPSWSWLSYASWSGAAGIQYHDYLMNFNPNPNLQFDFQRTYCRTEDSNAFGPVIEGRLCLRGTVAEGTMLTEGQYDLPSGFSPSHIAEDAYIRFGSHTGFPVHCDYHLPVDAPKATMPQDVLCLLVGSETKPSTFNTECRDFALILSRIDDNEHRFRRIGVAKWPQSSGAFAGGQERSVEIV